MHSALGYTLVTTLSSVIMLKTSLKIAMITDNFYPQIGGVEYCVDALGRHLTDLGHEVSIITRKRPGQHSDERKELLFIKRISYGEMLANVIGHSKKKHVYFSQFDIIHAHSLGSPLAILGILLAKKLKKPHVLTSHSLYRNFDKWIMRCFGKLLTHVICVSQAVIADIKSMKNGIQTYYIPNGFDSFSTGKESAFINLTKQPNELVIGTVSRLSSKKSVIDFIKIAALLIKKYDHLKFVIVGDGPQQKMLQKKARKLAISQHILFTGNLSRTKVFDTIKHMDIFILTSPHEAFGMVILEAIHHKIPIVARDNNGISDIITSNKTGYLANSPEMMVNYVSQLIENPVLRSEIATKAYPLIEKFQWHETTQKTVAVYHALLKPIPSVN